MLRFLSIAGTALFLIVLNIACDVPAFGEERTFNLQQAVEFALDHNGDLKALKDERGAREAGVVRAGLYPNPALSFDGTTGSLTGSPYENRVAVGISQEFITMGKRSKRQQVAEKELDGFDSHMANTRRLLVEDIKAAFWSLFLADKKKILADRSIVLNKQLTDVTRQRFEKDDIPELDVNLAKVEAARSEGRKGESEREYYLAKTKLLALMGFPPDDTARFIHSPERESLNKSLDELKRLALVKRPDIMMLEAERAKGSSAEILARAEAIPNITAGLAYQREAKSLDVMGTDVKGLDHLVSLKLSVPIPLFDRNQAGIREAQARKAGVETRYRYACQIAEREVEAAYARLVSMDKTLFIYDKDIMPQLEENLKLVQEAYRLGEVGILAVIEEQKKFYEVSDAYLAVQYSRQSALIKLEAAVGVDLTAM